MKWIDRNLVNKIESLVNSRPAVLLTGIRQSGKSSLLQKMYPKARYITFDNYRYAETAEENPTGFLNSLLSEEKVILDEIQYVPGLFRELKIIIDESRTIPAKWILTGSQKFVLLEAVRESLAGRIGLIELETLSADELRKSLPGSNINTLLWKGGFPETWVNKSIDVSSYLDDYVTTYLEKDLRSILQTPNLRDFHRFLRSCAFRAGSLVNYSDMSRDTGISPNTAKSWLNILARSGIITLLEPWFNNLSKRLTKTPKLYFNDQGILCRFLNITELSHVENHPYCGAIWENLVFNELIRSNGISSDRNLFYYRDQNNVEVDFLIENNGKIQLIEAKYSERPRITNIPKVARHLKIDEISCYCACRIPEQGLFFSSGVQLYNPLFTNIQNSLSQ